MAQPGITFSAVVISALVVVAIMPDRPAQQATRPDAGTSAMVDSQPISTMPPLSSRPPSAPVDSPAPPGPMMTSGGNYVALHRAPDSHFYVDAEVNGTTVHFLIDTGATSIVLAAADAQRVGFNGDDYTVTASTAGGEVKLMPVMAERIALGPFAANNVPILVAKDQLPISLLGQSYLSRIGNVTISGDRMMLQ